MLVNREGRVIRCSAYGYGLGLPGAIAMGTAEQIHDACVRDAGLIGFIPVPTAAFGFNVDPKNSPLKVIQVGSNAAAAGMRLGDVLVEADSRPLTHPFDLFHFLSNKRPGDRVVVKVQREQTIVPLNFQLVRRQANILDPPAQKPSEMQQSTPAATPTVTAAPPAAHIAAKSDKQATEQQAKPARPSERTRYSAQLFLVKGPIVTTPPQVFSGEFLQDGRAQVVLSGRRLLTGNFELFRASESVQAKYKFTFVTPASLNANIDGDATGFAALSDGSGTRLECLYMLTTATGRGEGVCGDNQKNTYRIVFD